ncbi:MAG: hypothetical protein ACPL4E_10020 [Thermoproteota archaeon]
MEFKHISGTGEVDGVISAVKDIVVGDRVVFKKGEDIAVIEIGSTMLKEKNKSLEDLLGEAIKDLKNHMQLDDYKNVQYGIAIGFRYKPVDVLAGWPSERIEIKIEAYTRSELGLGG